MLSNDAAKANTNENHVLVLVREIFGPFKVKKPGGKVCPVCEAGPGERCIGLRFGFVHVERWKK